MTPLETLTTQTLSNGQTVSLDRRGSTYFFRHESDTISTSNATDAGLILAEQVCHPIRGAKQPRILVACRGFGELAAGTLNVVIQKKGQIVIHDSDFVLRDWQINHFPDLHPAVIGEDSRVVSTSTPLPELLEEAPEGWHGIVADLDILAATNPNALDIFTTTKGLAKCAANLREGSLVGVTAAELDKKLINRMADAGLNPVTDSVPVATRARRSRMQTIIMAKRGEYRPQNARRRR